MYKPVAVFILASLANANAQHTSAGPNIQPSDPIESLGRALLEKPQPSAVKPSRLEIKPSSDPIYVVQESRWDGNHWQTFQAPKVDQYSRNGDGIAIQGYDVMSYLEKRAEKGKEQLQTEFGGVLWRFASEDHKRQFLLDPARFVPAYGGFCAYSIGRGYPATADPEAFAVHRGRVYLFFDPAVRAVWEQDLDQWISKADLSWPKVHR
jgi:YHS domain-containing protein